MARWCAAAVVAATTIAALGCVAAQEGGARDGAGEAEPPAEAVAAARAAARALGSELKGRLEAQLEAGGPVAALAVCSEVAQEIAARHSRDGAVVRRVSLRVRNPLDRPDGWERARLEELERLDAAVDLPEEIVEVVEMPGTEPQVVEAVEVLGTELQRELRYLKPIVVQPVCLECHGDPATFGPELGSLLAERYPEDEAVGYAAGDLRGGISVRLALPPHGQGGG